MFVIPHDLMFFVYWFLMIAISAIVSIFGILGLLQTKFFTTQVIGSLGFISSSICAAVFLNEPVTHKTIISLALALVGVALFSWKKESKIFSMDRGTVFIILAVILSGFSTVLFKESTFHTSSYQEFLTGRFVGDLIAWTAVWLISLAVLKRNPVKDLSNLVSQGAGKIYVIGMIVITMLDCFLIYNMTVTSLAILGTISFPVAYIISYFKYHERITAFMWLGTLFIASSIIVYLSL